MKNLFLTLSFVFISSILFAQEQFEGMWVEEGSSYINTILTSKDSILKVFNFSFVEDQIIEETIIEQSPKKFTTKLYNPNNGYSVTIEYEILNNSLICKYTGDYEETIKLNRL